MVMPFDVAVLGATHGVALEVIITVTTSPVAKALSEYTLLFVPTSNPLICH
jgi:hypothetical protein